MSETEPRQKIQFKRNKYEDFDLRSCSHQLLKGEPFYDSVTHRFVIGDGTDTQMESLKVVVTDSLRTQHIDTYVDGNATVKDFHIGDVDIYDFAVQILPNFNTSDSGKVLMINSAGTGLIWGAVESQSVGKAIANLTLSTNLSQYQAEDSQQNLSRVTCNITITNKAPADVITYTSLKIGTTGYGSSDLVNATSGIQAGSNLFEISPAKVLDSTTKIYAVLEYNVSGTNKTSKAEFTISFTLNPSYFAVSDVVSIDSITEDIIKSGDSVTDYDRAASHNYTLNGQRAIYAYRETFGDLSTIIINDHSSINQLGAFTKKSIQINGKAYNCYILNTRQIQQFKISFS